MVESFKRIQLLWKKGIYPVTSEAINMYKLSRKRRKEAKFIIKFKSNKIGLLS